MIDKPTTKQVMNEPAGKRLNIWVAELVMGWPLEEIPNNSWYENSGYRSLEHPIYYVYKEDVFYANKNGYGRFNPSKEINSAWKIVEQMRKDEYLIMIRDMGEEYCCEFLGKEDGEPIGRPGFHKTIFMAICKAALLCAQ